MTLGHAGVLFSAVRGEDDEQPADEHLWSEAYEYVWSDLKARRNTLCLWPEDINSLLGISREEYIEYEHDERDLLGDNRRLVDELIAMEAFVAEEADKLIEEAPEEGAVVLRAVTDQETFNVRYPDARSTQRRKNAYPVTLQYVAVGRAAAELRRRGRDVEVYRGERHFELAAARFAVGLSKTETSDLLGFNAKSYSRCERGADPPRQVPLKALWDLYDFIADTAGKLEVTVDSGVSVIWVVQEQAEFEKIYPEARFERSGTAYPIRAQWVAAGRLAGMLAAAGRPARIAALPPQEPVLMSEQE